MIPIIKEIIPTAVDGCALTYSALSRLNRCDSGLKDLSRSISRLYGSDG